MAHVFKKADMLYHDYNWTVYPNDDPRMTGSPDCTYLNREEGNEMLHFIKRYMHANGWKKSWTGQKIEKFLRTNISGRLTHAEWKKELEEWFRI